jgi:transposase
VPPRLDANALAVVRQLVAEDNDALLREYRQRLAERTGVTVCLAVICEALKRLKLRPNKRPFGRPSRSGPRLPPSARLIASR